MNKADNPRDWEKYRYGNRVFRAKRLTSGNWMVSNDEGTEKRAITHDEFQNNYERLPNEFQD